MKKAWVLSYPFSAQRRLWSNWAHMPFCWFCHEAAQMLIFTKIALCSASKVWLAQLNREFTESLRFYAREIDLNRGLKSRSAKPSSLLNLPTNKSRTWNWPLLSKFYRLWNNLPFGLKWYRFSNVNIFKTIHYFVTVFPNHLVQCNRWQEKIWHIVSYQ